jgi:Transposase zinc-binding domain
MNRPAFEMADIVRRKGRQFLERFKAILSYQQLKAYRAIERCRTAALGGHKDKCEDCQYEAPISYNSCRSRSCPKCQAQARKRCLEAQRQDLLNTNYYYWDGPPPKPLGGVDVNTGGVPWRFAPSVSI